MTDKIREIMRLSSLGISQRVIIKAVHCSSHTIKKTIDKAQSLDISYEDIRDKSNREITELFKGKRSLELYEERPDYEYVHNEMQKRNVTLKLLREEYSEKCIEKGTPFMKYTHFTTLYRQYCEEHKLTMHINRKLGEKLEVDWTGSTFPLYDLSENAVIGKAYLFVAVLPFSQYMYAEATADMKQGTWINVHITMFKHFEGVPVILVPDNLKTGVISHKKYEDMILNESYREMARYYGAVIVPARVRRPKDKSSAESSVGYLSTQLIARLRNKRFTSVSDINKEISRLLNELNRKPFQKRPFSRQHVFENEERETLQPIPKHPYEYGEWKEATVQYNYHIQVMKNWYSVPYRYVRKKVRVRITDSAIEIFYNNKRIAVHIRSYGKNSYTTSADHMPENHAAFEKWNSEKMKRWASDIGPSTAALIDQEFEKAEYEQHIYKRIMSILHLSERFSRRLMEQTSIHMIQNHISCSYRNFKSYIEYLHEQDEKTRSDADHSGEILRGASYYNNEDNYHDQ